MRNLILALAVAAIFLPRGIVTGVTETPAPHKLPDRFSAEYARFIARPAMDICKSLMPLMPRTTLAECMHDTIESCEAGFKAERPCGDDPPPPEPVELSPFDPLRGSPDLQLEPRGE